MLLRQCDPALFLYMQDAGVIQQVRTHGRLEEIRDKPAEPPNRFKWLTDFFPTKD